MPRTRLISGYVKGGFIAPFRFKGYTDITVFNQWVKKCLVHNLRPGQVVVLDNASFCKSTKTKELIEAAGCRLLFQPPYSPNLDKIEPMWANIKQWLDPIVIMQKSSTKTSTTTSKIWAKDEILAIELFSL